MAAGARQAPLAWMLATLLTICMVTGVQTASTTLISALTSSLVNSSSTSSSPTSSTLPCSCYVFGGTQDGSWAVENEPSIVATVYETVIVRSNTTFTTASTSYMSLSNGEQAYLSNGTGMFTSEGYAYVYPTEYYQIGGFSYDLCIAANDTDFNPSSLNITGFPYMGVTVSPYITPAPADSTAAFASFFELLGLPTTCTFVPTGAPFYLTAQSALTVTSIVSVSEKESPLSTAPGANPPNAISKTSSAPYDLVSATALTTLAPTGSVSSLHDAIVSPQASPPLATSRAYGTTRASAIAIFSASDPNVLPTPESLAYDSETFISHATPSPAVIISLTDGSSTALAPVLTIAGSVITANSLSQYEYGTQVLTPGGQITVSGTPISLLPSASAIVVAGSTHAIAPALQPPLITVDGTIITPNAASDYIIASQTLIPGGSAVIISGTPYSLAPTGPDTAIADSTSRLDPTDVLMLPTLTIAGLVVTPNAASDYIVGTQTIIPGGPAVTISGTPYSLAPSASYLVEGGTTESLTVQTSVAGLGGYIVSGLGALPTGTGGGANLTLHTGGADSSVERCRTMAKCLFVIGVSLLMAMP